MKRYDGAKHIALEKEKEQLTSQIEELAVKLNDNYESDEWTGENAFSKMARYQKDCQDHYRLEGKLSEINMRLEQMEDARPLSRKERTNPILDIRRRWFMGGSERLDSGEREVFMPEMTEEMKQDLDKRGLPQDGEFFDPWALATRNSKYDLPKTRMAVGDASRSDINTESASGAGDALGLAAPETWAAGVVESLQYFGSVASNCYNFNTSDGNKLHQNQLDTKDQEGELIVNQSQANSGAAQGVPNPQSTTIGNVTDVVFDSYWRTSGFLEARIETFQDIHFDVAGRIMREMERRLGRGWNRTFTVGGGGGNTGSNVDAPQGIALSAVPVDGGAGSVTSATSGVGIDYKNLLDMEYSIDLAYLTSGEGGPGGFTDAHGGMVGWMMHRNVEKALRLATYPGTNGAAGMPIWVPDPTNMGIATQRAPGRILGYPYSINNHLGDASAATNLSTHLGSAAAARNTTVTPLIFGACGHFGVRNIGGPMYYRFWDSETAKRMSVKFIGWSRRDSRSRGPHTSVNVAANAHAGSAINGYIQNDAYAALILKA